MEPVGNLVVGVGNTTTGYAASALGMNNKQSEIILLQLVDLQQLVVLLQ